MRTLVLLLALPWQTPAIRLGDVTTTPTQAVLSFEVGDATSCEVAVFSDAEMAQSVADTDPELFAGSRNCVRPGSAVDGSRVTFVVGARRAERAVDGSLRSRALAAGRIYYFQIRAGNEALTGSFRTRNIPLGKLYGEPYPFDRTARGRYGWPEMGPGTGGGATTDPLTGAELKRVSGPGLAYPEITKAAEGTAAYDTGGGGWSDGGSAAVEDGRTARYGGGGREALFVRSPTVCPDGWGCERAARWDIPYRSVDDVEVTVKAWCSSAACRENANGERNAEICLSTDGVSCATAWKSITVGVSAGDDAVVYPQNFPVAFFAAWRDAQRGDAGAPARPDLATYQGKVAVDGKEVTWLSGHTFNVGAWKAGSRIRTGTGESVIARVNSATSLTLRDAATSGRDIAYTASNFGLLIRKATASAAVLEVDGVSFRLATSHEFEMPVTGSWDFCSPTLVTDGAGKQGYLCRVNTAAGYPTLWFIAPSDGESRYLGAVSVPYNNDVRTGGDIDGNEGACLGGLTLSRTNPNELYCISRSNVSPSQGLLIYRGRYLPEGRAGCEQPAGYQAIASGIPCNFQWELMTRPSAGATLVAKAKAFNPEFDPARYPYTGLFAAQGDALGFYAWAGQDSMAWSIWVDTRTFEILSMQNYHSNAPCRFCAVHSFLQLGDANYNAVIVKDFVGGTGTNAGPYEVKVTGVAGAADTTLDAANFQACPGDIAARWREAGAAGVRCITVTLAGDPCDLTPSDWERSNRPACGWQAGGVALQSIQEGDEARDGNERFLFVKRVSANQWVLLRSYNVLHGPTLKEVAGRTETHRAGWSLKMACSAASDSAYVWVDFAHDANGTAMLRDNGLSRAEHGDVTSLGSVMSAYDATTDRFGRFYWPAPIPGRVNTPAGGAYFGGNTFGGISVQNAPVFRDYIQTHPSWRQVAAPEAERRWYLDGNPFAPQGGGVYTLWRQAATLVAGTLYKLGALPSPVARKVLPTVAWSGRNQLEDVSGPASRLSGAEADQWKYCVADLAGECVDGSQAGDVYVNIPSMSADGLCGGSFFFHRPCVTSMVNHGIGVSQYTTADTGQAAPHRFLTAHLQRYNATWTYSNAAPLPDGSWALVGGSWLDGARSDVLLVRIPPLPESDSIDRSRYVPVTIDVPARAGATRARVRFGYSENGPAGEQYCTSRKEACVSGGEPFAWAGEPQLLESCPNGCRIAVPGISSRVLYYSIEWFDDSRNVIGRGPLGAVAVP